MSITRSLPLILTLFGAAPWAHATITIEIIPAFAPVGPSSPSWSAYGANAMASLESQVGLGATDIARNVGDRTIDPTAYEVLGVGPIDPAEIVVTSFPSWRGNAAPTPGWDGPMGQFAAEFGNRVHFGLHAYGDGFTQFSLSDLQFSVESDDGGSFNDGGNFVGVPYSNLIHGIDWVDGIKGNGNDVIYDGSFATTGSELVDELIYVGVGTGFEAGLTGLANPQAEIDDVLAYCDCGLEIKATYTLRDHTGSTTVDVLPEPGSMGIFLLGALGLGFARKGNGTEKWAAGVAQPLTDGQVRLS